MKPLRSVKAHHARRSVLSRYLEIMRVLSRYLEIMRVRKNRNIIIRCWKQILQKTASSLNETLKNLYRVIFRGALNCKYAVKNYHLVFSLSKNAEIGCKSELINAICRLTARKKSDFFNLFISIT